MFRTCVIKNQKRAPDKRIPHKSINECSSIRPDERSLPYFEVVPEQVLSDSRYCSLTIEQQGHFWRLIVHLFARENGILVRHPGVIAKRLEVGKEVWNELERLFLDKGLLIEVDDGDYLVQHEFREQYLQTLASNNAKRHNQDGESD